jgi:hypothetical protein
MAVLGKDQISNRIMNKSMLIYIAILAGRGSIKARNFQKKSFWRFSL